jgi:hypothetical protein
MAGSQRDVPAGAATDIREMYRDMLRRVPATEKDVYFQYLKRPRKHMSRAVT